jgi:glycosyltransferase involved in cell wall biosynthesis
MVEVEPTHTVDDGQLRVVLDIAVLRRPPTGIGRWVTGLITGLEQRADLKVTLALGPSIITRGGRLHRVPNLLRERMWYEHGLWTVARQTRAQVLLLPANLTARRGSIPQVVSIMDVNFLSEPGTYERTFVAYAKWAYRRSIRDAARVTTISAFSRSEIARHLDVDPGRIDVVYPGLEAPVHQPSGPDPHPRPFALYAGATERHKNVGLLLDAWRDRSPGDLDLVFVGQPGRDHPMAVEAAARSGGRVVVRGRVDAEELDRWYRKATVFVFPSRVEGFGFPPLEAMQRGVPVVASTGGSLPEVLGDGALFFDPDDQSAVIAHVERVVSDPGLRTSLIDRGAKQAARYTWTDAAHKMAGLLRVAVREHGRSLNAR